MTDLLDLVAAWVLAPALLWLLCAGVGLAFSKLLGGGVEAALLPGYGLAAVTVLASLAVVLPATAFLALPLVVLVALTGLGGALWRPWRRRGWPGRQEPSQPTWRPPGGLGLPGWAVATALTVFAIYAAPVVLSGAPTFTGYIKLDDTATWLAITSQVLDHGRDLSHLAVSTYRTTLDVNLSGGYPAGAFLPLAILGRLTGVDPAWLFNPYMASIAAMLALATYSLARGLIGSGAARFAIAVISTSSALFFSYYLWGGIKEVLSAALLATACAIAAGFLRREQLSAGSLVPLAVIGAAAAAALSLGGSVWLGPVLIALAATFSAAYRRGQASPGSLALAVAVTVLLLIPLLAGSGVLPRDGFAVLTSAEELGNLIEPLSLAQIAGVWPAGDFRVDPESMTVTAILIALVLSTAAIGTLITARRRAWMQFTFVAGSVAVALILTGLGSPWTAGKALAIASPAVLFGAGVAIAAAWSRGLRVPALIALTLVGGGVAWSNAAAYREVPLAPYEQMRELQEIGESLAGDGPTLITEYQPYAARYFLREGDPEALSELRYRPITLTDGSLAERGSWHDTDRIVLDELLIYRTLVLRRSPQQSRPPSVYKPVWTGRFYEVWQRPAAAGPGRISDRLALGSTAGQGGWADPGAIPGCGELIRFAATAAAGTRLVAAPARQVIWAGIRPEGGWAVGPGPGLALPPRSGGETRSDLTGTGATVYVGGSVPAQLDLLSSTGQRLGSIRAQRNPAGQYLPFDLEAGAGKLAGIRLAYSGSGLRPGSGAAPTALGPVALDLAPGAQPLIELAPAQVGRLCGQRLDWVELRR